MRVALYGRPQVAAVLVACAELAQSAGAVPAWRRASAFKPDQCEPFDLVIAVAGSAQAAVIAEAYDRRRVPTVLVPADGLTPEILEALRVRLGLPPTAEGTEQPNTDAEVSATSDAVASGPASGGSDVVQAPSPESAPASVSAPIASPPGRRRRG